MRTLKLLFAAATVSGMAMFVQPAPAADAADHAMTGVLIDNACGAKQKDEAAAAKHPLACSKKDACADSGYQLVVGDKHYKLDDKGNAEAKTYLATAKSTKVTIDGSMDGDMMKVTSIKAAADKK
jgi:hypothetical protein